MINRAVDSGKPTIDVAEYLLSDEILSLGRAVPHCGRYRLRNNLSGPVLGIEEDLSRLSEHGLGHRQRRTESQAEVHQERSTVGLAYRILDCRIDHREIGVAPVCRDR